MILLKIANGTPEIGLAFENFCKSFNNITKAYQEWDGSAPREKKIEKLTQVTSDVGRIMLIGAGFFFLIEQVCDTFSSRRKHNDVNDYIGQIPMNGCDVDQSNQMIGENLNVQLNPTSTNSVTEYVVKKLNPK